MFGQKLWPWNWPGVRLPGGPLSTCSQHDASSLKLQSIFAWPSQRLQNIFYPSLHRSCSETLIGQGQKVFSKRHKTWFLKNFAHKSFCCSSGRRAAVTPHPTMYVTKHQAQPHLTCNVIRASPCPKGFALGGVQVRTGDHLRTQIRIICAHSQDHLRTQIWIICTHKSGSSAHTGHIGWGGGVGWGGVGWGGEGWGSHTSEHPGSTPGLCTYRKNPKYGHWHPHTEAACTYDPRVYRRSPSPRVQTIRFPRVQTNPCPASEAAGKQK